MKIIPVICLGVLCLLMAIVYTVFSQKSGWQGLLVRGLAILSCILFSQISANLNAINNALPLFTILGLSLLILCETLKVAGIASEKAQVVTFGALNSVAFTLISLSALSLGEFNAFALIGGVFFGIAGGLLVCAIKKYKKVYRVFSEIFTFMAIGFIIGFGLMSILSTTHFLSAICMLAGGTFLLLARLINGLSKGGKVSSYISNALFIIGLTVISLATFLY